MPEQILPVVDRDDYDRFFEIVGHDLEWPESFDGYREQMDQQIAQCKALGSTPTVPVIDFDEFVEWCRYARVPTDGIHFNAFAIQLDWPPGSDPRKAREIRRKVSRFLSKRH